MRAFLYYLAFLITFIACRTDELPTIDELQPPHDNQMHLDSLQVGQIFKYIKLKASNYPNPDSTHFTYTGDTLILEVIDEIDGKFLIEERISDGSPIKQNTSTYPSADSIYVNYWQIRNDSLIVGDPSSSTYILSSHLLLNRKFPLIDFDDLEVEVAGWKTSHPYIEGNVELFTRQYLLLGNMYYRLNIYINNIAMTIDGPGNTTFYSRRYGIVRSSTYSWWTGTGTGWDKL